MLKICLQAAIVGIIAFILALVVIPAWRSFQQQFLPLAPRSAEELNLEPNNFSASERAENAIARYNLYLAIFTFFLVLVGAFQGYLLIRAEDVANRTAQAAQVSAEVAKQTLIAGQRAWIRIDQIGFGGGGLAIDNNGASVSISFKVTNIGNSPAINITHHAWLLVFKKEGPFPQQEQQRLCNEIRSKPLDSGFTLFPNESFPASIGVSGWGLGTNVTREDLEQAVAMSPDKKMIPLYVIGCIDYAFPTDLTKHHQTGFIYEVRQDGAFPITFKDGIIPIDRLSLVEWGIAGGGRYAD